jgi:hypothetical protein
MAQVRFFIESPKTTIPAQASILVSATTFGEDDHFFNY